MMANSQTRIGERPAADDEVLVRVKKRLENVFDELDVHLFEERLPPLLRALSGISDKANEALRRPGRTPVAWLRINNMKGRFREAETSRGHMADPLRAAPDILGEIRQGGRRLVLDCSHEGRVGDPDRPFAALEDILRGLGVSPDSVMVLTQNAAATERTAALAVSTDVGVAAATTHSHLVNIWRMMASSRSKVPMPRVGFAAASTGPRPFRYTSLNFTIRGARALLVARLLRRGEPGYMSFSTERSRTNKAVEDVMKEVRKISLPGKRRENVKIVQRLFEERVERRADLDPMSKPQEAVYRLPEEGLKRSELFLVTETEIGDARLARFTEKTIKAIIAGLPFVIFGNKGTVATMREVGFDVFDGLVDHGYDEIDDPRERFDAAWTESARLLDLGPGLVDRHRTRIDAANAANALAFRDNVARHWIERPLEEISAWAAGRSAPVRDGAW